jgi:Cu/Ag efflux protein CusF
LAAYLEAGSVVLQYAGRSMEFLVPDASAFRVLKPGKKIGARARKRGHDTIVEDPRPQ